MIFPKKTVQLLVEFDQHLHVDDAIFYVHKVENNILLKVVSTTFLLVCFFNLKQSTCESRKNVFRILDIQVSLRHQILRHKTRNTFY